MLKTLLTNQRPQAQELLVTLDRNPELAADATTKVRHALLHLRSNSAFIKFAVSRFLRAVRVIQLFFKRCLAGFRSMRQRALFEWNKRGDVLPSDVLLHRLPTEAVRREVVAQEFAKQRAKHRAERRAWRKGEIHLEGRRAEIERELAELVSRPSGYSTAAFRTLQERLTYVSGRLAHHRAMAPQFRGMEVVVKDLNNLVASAMRNESSSRVQSAMKSIGLASEDPKFFDTVVKRYEFLVEEEFAKRRLAKLMSGVRSGSILRGHRASVLIASGSAPPIPKPGPVTSPIAATARTSPRSGGGKVTIRTASIDASQAASQGADLGQWNDMLPTPRGGVEKQPQLLSVLTPKAKRKVNAASPSTNSVGEVHQPVPMSTQATGVEDTTIGSADQDIISDAALRCYAALGLSLDELKQPVEDVYNKKFSAELLDAMQWSGLVQTTAASAACLSQDRDHAAEMGAAEKVGAPVTTPPTPTTSPTRRKNYVVVKEFPKPPSSPRPSSARDFTKLRLETHSSTLRKDLSPSKRRRLRFTIGSDSETLPSASQHPRLDTAEDNCNPKRESAQGGEDGGVTETDNRRRRCLSPKKAATDSNLVALRQAAREKRTAALARKVPFLPLPPPIRLEDMRTPSPPWIPLTDDDGRSATPPPPGGVAAPMTRADPHWSPVPPEIDGATAEKTTRRKSGTVATIAAAAAATTVARQPEKLTDATKSRNEKELRTADIPAAAPPPPLVATCGSVSMNSAGQIFVHGCLPKQYSRDHQLDGFVHDASSPTPRKFSTPTDMSAAVVTSALPALPRPVTSLLWMAAPSERDACSGYVVAGCSDGSLRIFAATFAAGGYVEVYSSGDVGGASRDSLLHLCQWDNRFLYGAIDNLVTVVACSRAAAPPAVSGSAAALDSGVHLAHRPNPKQQRGNYGPIKVSRGPMEFKSHRKIRANASITSLLPVPPEVVGQKHPHAVLLVTTFDSVIELFDVSTASVYLRLDGHVQSVEGAFISKTTKKIVTHSHDCTVKLWAVFDEEHSGGVLSKAASGVADAPSPTSGTSGNARAAAASTAADSGGPIVAVSTFTQHHAAVLCCVDVAGPQTIASISRDNTIRIWDQVTLESFCVVSHIPGHLFLGCASSISNAVATFAFSDGTVRCFSTETGKLLQCSEVRGAQVCRSVGPNHVAVGSTFGTLAVASVDSGRIVAVSESLHYNGIRAVAAAAAFATCREGDVAEGTDDSPLHLLVGGEDRRISMLCIPPQSHLRTVSFKKNSANARDSTPPPLSAASALR